MERAMTQDQFLAFWVEIQAEDIFFNQDPGEFVVIQFVQVKESIVVTKRQESAIAA